MNHTSTTRNPLRFRSIGWLWLIGVSLLFLAGNSAQAQLVIKPGKRVVGERVSPPGTMFTLPAKGKTWEPLGKSVYAGYRIMALPGLTGEVNLANGRVRLSLLGNLPGSTPSPALESRVVINAPKTTHVDLTLERGRIRLTNQLKDDKVSAMVRFLDQSWHLVLSEPGTSVLVERNSVWPTGFSLPLQPDPKNRPVTYAFVLVTKGPVLLNTGKKQYTLTDQMIYQWNSEFTKEPEPQKLPKKIDLSPKKEPKIQAVVEELTKLGQRASLEEGSSLTKAIQTNMESKDKNARLAGILVAGAIDEPSVLLKALVDKKDPSLRDAAVLVFRSWVNQSELQPSRLYQFLQQNRMKESDAETFLQLLPGFSSNEASRLETYEILISYLNHPEPTIRQLAGWNLYRLMPKGSKIAFDPLASEAQRQQAQTAWTKFLQEQVKPKKKKN